MSLTEVDCRRVFRISEQEERTVNRRRWICAATALLVSGCVASDSNDPAQAPAIKPIDARFVEELLAIANEYEAWEKVDENPAEAALDCRAPSTYAGLPRLSDSGDSKTHGRKLYYLHARNKSAYLAVGEAAQTAQAIVKQAWHAREVGTAPDSAWNAVPVESEDGRGLVFAAVDEGRLFVPGEQASLFIMFRPTDKSGSFPDEATDDGWIYGTVRPDGKTVSSCGLVRSCMGCHQSAPHGRLYGLKVVRG